MGRNGAGKSTVFEVLELLRDFAARGNPCEDRLVGDTKTRWQNIDRQRFELEVLGTKGTYRYELVVDEWGRPTTHPRVRKESVTLDEAPLFLFKDGTVHLHNDSFQDRVQFPFDTSRSGLYIVEDRPDNTKLSWFKNWLKRVLYIQIDPDPKRISARSAKVADCPRPAMLESRAISEVTTWKAATENWSHNRVDFVLATAECRDR